MTTTPDTLIGDTAERVLGAAIRCRHTDRATAAELLDVAARWADPHPAGSPDTTATFSHRGDDTQIPIGGGSGRLVDAMAVAEFGVITLHGTTEAAQGLISEALELRHRLPRLWQLVHDLTVPAWDARYVARQTAGLSDQAAGYVDRTLVPVAGRIGRVKTERLVQAAIIRFIPDQAAAQQAAQAEWRRFDICHPGQHGGYTDLTTGLSIIDGVLYLHDALDLPDALDLEAAVAHGAAVLKRLGDPSCENVRRARAAGDLARAQPCLNLYLDDGLHDADDPNEPDDHDHHDDPNEREEPGKRGESEDQSEPAEPLTAAETVRRQRAHSMPKPRQITLYLHLAAEALTGSDPAPCVGRVGNTHNPVHLDQLRDWLSAPNTQIVVKPVIDLNQPITVDAYEIPDRIREHVTLRNPTWVFPWCTRPAERCDLDHTQPYRRAGSPGQTSTDNLAPLCRRHHRLKTFTGWRHQVHDHPGTYRWTSPYNTSYLRDHTGTTELTPEPHPPDPD